MKTDIEKKETYMKTDIEKKETYMKTDIEKKEIYMKTDTENKEQNREPKKEQVKEQRKEPKKENKEKNVGNKEHPSIIKNFIGKEIAITLRNGNKIKGKLETVAQYELVITVAYNPIIVMKHAIDYIELAGEK